MFDPLRPRFGPSICRLVAVDFSENLAARDWRPLVGVVALCYVAALSALVVAGPVFLVEVLDASLVVALRRVAVVAAVAYFVGMGLLLR